MRRAIKPAAFDPRQEMRTPQIEIRYCLDENSPTVAIHSHNHYELYLFCEGDLERYVVGSKSYCLRRGDILLIPPMEMHHPVFREQARRYERYVLWCAKSYWNALLEQDPELGGVMALCKEREEYLLRFSPGAAQFLERQFQAMWAETQGGGICHETAMKAACMDLLVRLNRCVAAGEVMDETQDIGNTLLTQVIAYIHENYGLPITLQDTAKRFFVSPSTVEYQFTQKLGCSFYRYVTRRRIVEAQNQIAAGIPIKAVAQNCGYTDYSIFYKAFVKETGSSPSNFRRLWKNREGETLVE